MSMSALLSALRGAGRRQVSASTIGVRQASGSHVLRIDGFSQLSKTVAIGEEMSSDTFKVGGHDWRILCYPNGLRDEYKGYISLFIEHASHARTGDTTAKVAMSILPDMSSEPTRSQTTTDHRFTRNGGLNWGWRDFIKHEDLEKEKHLKDDHLTILCDVTVTEPRTDKHVEVPSPESKVVVAPPPFDLRGQLADAIWNIKKVDVKIEVGGVTFPAHRWVLEAQSPVFKEELSLASTAGGATKLRVDDMDAEVFKALLRFMYTNSPPETSQLEEGAMATKLLVAADRYKVEKLKLICEEALCQHIGMETVAATLAFAERHHCSSLEAACMKFLSSPGYVEAFLASGGLQQMKTGCPIALSQFVAKKIIERERLAS